MVTTNWQFSPSDWLSQFDLRWRTAVWVNVWCSVLSFLKRRRIECGVSVGTTSTQLSTYRRANINTSIWLIVSGYVMKKRCVFSGSYCLQFCCCLSFASTYINPYCNWIDCLVFSGIEAVKQKGDLKPTLDSVLWSVEVVWGCFTVPNWSGYSTILSKSIHLQKWIKINRLFPTNCSMFIFM